jgi:hydrogenase maturation protein HypF
MEEVPWEGFETFEIRFSDESTVAETTLVSPDLATCDDCLEELFNPKNRRYRYPFINCTNCGPRFTIIDSLPYDRPRTSMKAFGMCDACQHEYDHPENRRFHAQPDACFECGPQLTFTEFAQADALPEGDARTRSDAIIARTAELLRTGRIVAIKGLGGFHLACDATSDAAVATLRERKRRPKKPLAVMYPSIEAVERAFAVSPEERALLTSPARPIVLLRGTAPELSAGITCELPEVGVMLPSTPLQHLLLAEIGGTPLVMTSGDDMKTVQLELGTFRDEGEVFWNQLMAATLLSGVPIYILFFFAQKHFVSGLLAGSVKG